jgi:hypothetical protein
MVDPRKMCSQHIRGEHFECHMFVGSICKGISMKGYVEKGMLDSSMLLQRHDELVEEMLRRNMNHQSEISLEGIKQFEGIGSVDVRASIAELIKRCPDCRKKLENIFIQEDNN